jgi:predicted secreted Zn-dependent protease
VSIWWSPKSRRKKEVSVSSRWIDSLCKKRWVICSFVPFSVVAILLSTLHESESLLIRPLIYSNRTLDRSTQCIAPPPHLSLFKRAGTSVEFYEIIANDLFEVSAKMSASGPLDDDNIHRDALLSWSIIWRWNGETWHSPMPVRVRATTRLVLPRWCPSVSPSNEEKGEWNRYLLQVLEHEAGHLHIFLEYRETFESALSSVGSSCNNCPIDDLNKLGKELITRLNEKQRLYDKETSHGATQFARLVSVKEN